MERIREGKWGWIFGSWTVGALAAAAVAFAPATAWGWVCALEFTKTVAVDDNCDGEADGPFVENVTQEFNECVLYRFCIENTGQQTLVATAADVNDTILGQIDDLDFGAVGGKSPVNPSCLVLPARLEDDFHIPVPACTRDPESCVCDEVEGTNTATLSFVFCEETLVDACDQTLSDCIDTAIVACAEEGNGCMTRSPGFWANHPDVIEAVLAEYGSITSCGSTLAPGVLDLCPPGRARWLTPRLAQLRRQCAAAALNLALTDASQGSCAGELSADRFAACCTNCGTVGANCLSDLGAFNVDDGGDLCEFFGLAQPCSAEPLQCAR